MRVFNIKVQLKNRLIEVNDFTGATKKDAYDHVYKGVFDWEDVLSITITEHK